MDEESARPCKCQQYEKRARGSLSGGREVGGPCGNDKPAAVGMIEPYSLTQRGMTGSGRAGVAGVEDGRHDRDGISASYLSARWPHRAYLSGSAARRTFIVTVDKEGLGRPRTTARRPATAGAR